MYFSIQIGVHRFFFDLLPYTHEKIPEISVITIIRIPRTIGIYPWIIKVVASIFYVLLCFIENKERSHKIVMGLDSIKFKNGGTLTIMVSPQLERALRLVSNNLSKEVQTFLDKLPPQGRCEIACVVAGTACQAACSVYSHHAFWPVSLHKTHV